MSFFKLLFDTFHWQNNFYDVSKNKYFLFQKKFLFSSQEIEKKVFVFSWDTFKPGQKEQRFQLIFVKNGIIFSKQNFASLHF